MLDIFAFSFIKKGGWGRSGVRGLNGTTVLINYYLEHLNLNFNMVLVMCRSVNLLTRDLFGWIQNDYVS